MPFVMELTSDGFVPAVRCDHCGAAVTAETGLVLWSLDPTPALGYRPVLVACDSDCADSLAARHPDTEWATLALDTYLVILLEDSLEIDAESVRERDALAWAIEQTRDEVDQALD